jgi:uncharacterized protein YjiS (DUF1127 family)
MRKNNMDLEIGKALLAIPTLLVFGLAWVGVELAERLYCYRQSRRERAQLLAMGERDLRDLGLSRIDALRLATPPTWRECAKPRRTTP